MIDRGRMESIAQAESTISGKIRALDRAGFKRADIARFLNRRYQHVRNVLEAEKLRTPTASEPTRNLSTNYQTVTSGRGASFVQAFFRLHTNPDGSLIVPAYVLASVGIGGDEVVIGSAEGDQLTLSSATASMRRAQELVAELLPGEDSFARSLIADRRRELEEERADG